MVMERGLAFAPLSRCCGSGLVQQVEEMESSLFLVPQFSRAPLEQVMEIVLGSSLESRQLVPEVSLVVVEKVIVSVLAPQFSLMSGHDLLVEGEEELSQ